MDHWLGNIRNWNYCIPFYEMGDSEGGCSYTGRNWNWFAINRWFENQ